MKILIATDGSECSKAAVEESRKLVAIHDATEVRVVSVFEDAYAVVAAPVALSAEFYQELSDASNEAAVNSARAAADKLRADLKDAKVEIKDVVVKGSPELEIVEMAKDWNADLIVVGSHGRGFLGRMLGSVSDAVVHHAPCSVLVVKRRAEEHRGG